MGALEVARIAPGRDGIVLGHDRHVAQRAPIIKAGGGVFPFDGARGT